MMKRKIYAQTVLVLAMLAGVASLGRAAQDIPTYETLFFNTYYPKAGQAGMNVAPHDVEAGARTIYEGWWREESYWRSDPVTGSGLHGFNMKSRTYMDMAMPWTHGITTNMNSPALWGGNGRGDFNLENLGTPKNHPGQRHGGTGSLRDGVWTPGERFTDQMSSVGQGTNQPPDGEWNDVVLAEDFWKSDNTNRMTGISQLRRSLTLTQPPLFDERPTNYWSATHGEYYADYNNDTIVNDTTTRVIQVGVSTNLIIWVADTRVGHHTNIPVRLSEMFVDIPNSPALLPPPSPYSDPANPLLTNVVVLVSATNDGDFSHTLEAGGLNTNNVSVARNGLFDYDTDLIGNPIVYPAFQNGLTGPGQVNRAYVMYTSYLWVVPAGPYLSGPLPNPSLYYQIPNTGSGNPNANPGLPPSYQNDFGSADVETALYSGQIRRCTIYVPIYQAGELWGVQAGPGIDPYSGEITTMLYNDDTAKYGDYQLPNDNQWTPGRDHEPYDDFLSWWMPDAGLAGAWVSGVAGAPTNGVVHLGSTPLGKHMGGGDNVITFAEYSKYINDNYPGNCAALIKRCGNGHYDGPDEWQVVPSPDTGKYQQFGYMTGISTPPPGTYGASGWDRDSAGNSLYGGTFSGWWQATFGAYAAGSPAWESLMPNMALWPGYPSNAFVSVVTTNFVKGVPVMTYSDVVYPPVGCSWSYKSPREFDDLPSSMYHTAGDGRLGEETSPWIFSIFGEDKGSDLPSSRNMTGGDSSYPASGPLAFDVQGTDGLDAGNQMNIEWLTWRTDGQYFTGPRGGGVGTAPVYTGDHRDVNLDGLIDMGSTVPERSSNYSVDTSGANSGGRLTAYPYNWQRYFEDCVAAWDTVENFNDVKHNGTEGLGVEEIKIQAPDNFVWTNGMATTNAYLPNICYAIHTPPFHATFDPATDDMWFDANGDNIFNNELIINNVTRSLLNGTPGLPLVARYIAIDGNATFTPGLDFAWWDANGNGAYDADLVLSDTTHTLANGTMGVLFNTRHDNGVADVEKLYYQECDGIPGPSLGDNFWLENRTTNTTTVGFYDTDGTDLIVYQGSSADLVLTNHTPGIYLPNASYHAIGRSAGLDTGWVLGDDVWVDTLVGGVVGRFDGEEAVHAPYGICFNNYPFADRAVIYSLMASNTTRALNNVRYVQDLPGPYSRLMDDVFIDSSGDGKYTKENILIDNGHLVNGTHGTTMPNVAWLDLDGNGVYSPITTVVDGESIQSYGDVLWYDANGNHKYDVGQSYTVPLYFMGWGNPNGTFQIGPHIAGFGYSVPTRDGVTLKGVGHVWPASTTAFAGATHEQGHELVGWVDYYDYNVSDPDVNHFPIGVYDLMANGGLVHGIGTTKYLACGGTWVTPNYLETILGRNAGVQTVYMYPVEAPRGDQYYTFMNPASPGEGFNFWYTSGQSPYSVYPGQKGILIEHFDSGNNYGHPLQQRSNARFRNEIVPADGLYQAQDGINAGDPGDLWGNANKVFGEMSFPRAIWWSGQDAGIRINDIRLPANPANNAPAEVDFEWVTTTNLWFWTGPSAAAALTGQAGGAGVSQVVTVVTNVIGTNVVVATNSVAATSALALAPGVGAGLGGGFFGPRAGNNRGDSDGDGIPDDWELYWFGRYPNALTVANATSDWDGDGLPDYAEWLAHLNPMNEWSWSTQGGSQTGITDADADLTGDHISNIDKYHMGLNMREPDSDDDGLSDATELNPAILKIDQTGPGGFRRVTSPLYSRSPLIERSLQLTAADQLSIPSWEINDYTRFQVTNWTVEAWVKLGTSNETGTIVSRVTPQGRITFVLGFYTNTPYTAFNTDGGNLYQVVSTNGPVLSNVWHHVAGVFSQSNNALRLYMDGALLTSITALELPASGHQTLLNGSIATGTVKLGGGFNGFVDEVRVWGSNRSGNQIAYEYDKIINSPWLPGVQVINGVSTVITSIVHSVGNDGSLICNLRFDDGQNTTITNALDGTVHSAGIEDWVHPLGPNEGTYWNGGDRVNNHGYCVMLTNNATLTSNTADVVQMKLSDVQPSPIDDVNEDGLPDWWQVMYWPNFDPTVAGLWSPDADPDGDGLTNLEEYQLDTNPTDAYTTGAIDESGAPVSDGDFDTDGDGLSNADELHLFHTDPKNTDTDDDGIPDGEEVGARPSAMKLAYGLQNIVTGPNDSLSPWIPRCMVLGLTNFPQGITVPHSDRFSFTTIVTGGPSVKITQPLDGALIGVRFTAVQGSVASTTPLSHVRLYNNDLYVADLTLDASSNFNYTAIIRSGANVLTVVAVDTEGLFASAAVTVTGTFAPADIRVTQTWDQPGDLDTWLIDPQGRHMGWTISGPGYPPNAGSGRRIPGAFLDIDDITGTGPENITVQQGSATTGVYNVWMNNFANRNSPNSTVRVLIKEGQPGEKYMEFGPQSMPVSDGDGNNPLAWWHTTDITWPDGTMSPPGTPVTGSSSQTIADEGVGFNANKGWTIECWVKLGNANQSGAIARYQLGSGTDAFVVGVCSNGPYMMVRGSGGNAYQLQANPLPTNQWVHLAFVYGEGAKSIRIHENGMLVCSRSMLEMRTVQQGTLYLDAPLALVASTNRFTNAKLDELRFWGLARSGGLISQNMHSFVDTSATLVCGYHFDDGGKNIEDMKYPKNTVKLPNNTYMLRGLPDLLTDAKPGPDGVWGTADDIPAGVGPDGQNDVVTATDWAPVYGMRDSNNNGLPDWFEEMYGVTDPYADPDKDGLDNLHEYWCGTNPLVEDTNGNGIMDGDEDFDGDGLSNLAEQQAGTDPRLPDTDDDSVSDAMEVRYGTNGADPTSPPKKGSLVVDGSLGSYVRATPDAQQALTTFDISAWVYPTVRPTGNAEIVARALGNGLYNYCLGMDSNNVPFVQFSTSTTNVTLSAPVLVGALPLNEWAFVRAIFDAASGKLSLYQGTVAVRQTLVASAITEKQPLTQALGPIELRVGCGFAGMIDNVLVKGAAGTLIDYRFDDNTAANPVVSNTCPSATYFGSGRQGWAQGGQVQNYTVTADWNNHWIHAGTLVGGARMLANFNASDTELPSTLDSDGDGLPDWWKIRFGLNPYKADSFGDGVLDINRDMSGDGLKNSYIYLMDADHVIRADPRNPLDPVTGKPLNSELAPIYLAMGTTNGLTNAEKQRYGLHPLLADTDDDGVSDYDEVKGTSTNYPGWFTMPNASLSPAKSGVLKVSGAGYVQMPTNQARIAIDGSWTVEAWVNIDPAFGGNGKLIQRAIGTAVNYELGFTNGIPYARLSGVYSGNLYDHTALGTTTLDRRNQWYHLAGVYDTTTQQLRLLVDGRVVATVLIDAAPSLAYGSGAPVARVGEGFRGLMDEVRVWDSALSATDLAVNAYQTFENVANGPVLYYRFDDGPFGVSTTTNRFGLAINTVEDFSAAPADWNFNWAHAGTLVGDAVMTNAASPIPATQFVDQDGDDLPDFWEIAAFGSIATYTGKDDPDGDGLNNFYEYRAHLNPLAASTFNDNISDYDRDSDGDGLSNGEEQQLGTMPDVVDTDDDGKWDGAEVNGVDKSGNRVGVSDPLNSLNPYKLRSLSLNGNARVVVPAQGRHAMNQQFTLAAWVWPSNNANGIVVARTLSDGTVNYEMGVDNSSGTLRPYIRYTALTNGQPQDIRVEAGVGLPSVTMAHGSTNFDVVAPQTWSHIAGSYLAASNTLQLYVNGELVAWRTDAVTPPVTGAGANLPLGGELTIGGGRMNTAGTAVSGGLAGYISDVRLAAKAYNGDAIRQMMGCQMVNYTNGAPTNTSQQISAKQIPACKPNELIIGMHAGADMNAMAAALAQSGVTVLKTFSIIPAMHVQITDGSDISAKLTALQSDSRFAYVSLNYVRQLVLQPNDARFGEMWDMNNTGTNGPGNGTAGADIHALKAWDSTTGKKSVIVAVIDTGIDYNHPDIAANMWHNPGEIPNNGIDDDGNGYIDDVYGIAPVDPDPADPADPYRNNVMDGYGHGTHCAGTIGAVGNNGAGICGVNWNVQLMAIKIFNNEAGGATDAVIIEGIEYAWKMGARVSNNSYGGAGYDQALHDAIQTAGNHDHLFCAAAGNNGTDDDQLPFYPAAYDCDNIISVAATDNRDNLAAFSCYGAKSVDLGAPGVDILSTFPSAGSVLGKDYGVISGTSMAAPHVTGAAALLLSVDNSLTYAAVKAAILNNIDPDPALDGKTATGGRLNIANMLPKSGGNTPVIVNGLAGWFRFDDGGTTAEDFTLVAGWRNYWRFAGQPSAGAAMTTNNPHVGTGDSTGGGIPDWWKIANGLDPYDNTGDNGADGDPDGDGLSNLYEYLAGTDPHQADTGNTGISDYDKDSDNDGISNGDEQDIYHTNPGNPDTDDDGVMDGQELTNNTDPASSLSPFVNRALAFGGGAGGTVVAYDKVNNKYTARYSEPEWTIEAYVNPSTIQAGACPLVSRSVVANGRRNYELGLYNGVPYVAFDAKDSGMPVMLALSNNQAVTTNRWTHLAGRFTLSADGLNNELALFVDGVKVITMSTGWQSETGPGDLVFGSPGFVGLLSDIRLWKLPRDDQSIADARQHKLVFGNSDNSAGRLQLNGTGYLKETATTSISANGDYIDMLRNNWTLECWMRSTSKGVSLIERRNQSAATADNFNYYLGISPGGTLLGRFAIDYTYAVLVNGVPSVIYNRDFHFNDMLGSIPVNDGQWHHVAYVRSDKGCYLYVDGLLDSSQSRLMVDPTIPSVSYVIPPAVFAQPGPCIFGDGVTGELDELRIWNRALPTAELKDVSSRNLTGNERGLVSYFNFDFQTGITADERSVLRDPTAEYGIYIPQASLLRGAANGAPISYNPLLAIQRVALVGLFLCSDGGITVEDYVYPMGIVPFNFDAYAGHRGTNVSFVALSQGTTPYGSDSDGDGMPDWWEVQYGLDPSSSSGDNGPWGDPDGDGLCNVAEYLAGTNPHNPDTPGSGFLDYDNRNSSNSLTYGELFTPMDSLPALWKFNHGLDPTKYVAEDDSDHDGWSNYGEYMAGANPVDPGDMPQPAILASFWYAGTAKGNFRVESYTTALRDGPPDAVFTVSQPTGSVQTINLNTGTTVGHVREGDNWFFAYIDKNGNNQWDPGEPCGYAVYQPISVGWSAVNVDFNIQDNPVGYPRIAWTVPTGASYSRVQVDYTYAGGSNNVVDVMVRAPRSYLTEADLVFALAKTNGMGTPSKTTDWTPSYRWSVMFDPASMASTFVPGVPYQVFTQNWTTASFAKPSIVSPLNETIRTLPLQFEWNAGDNVAAFTLELRQNSTTGSVVQTAVVRAPFYRDNGGAAHYCYKPQYAVPGFLTVPDGIYYWRVTPNNNPPLSGTTASDWSRLVLDTTGAYLPTSGVPQVQVTGPFAITGELDYCGKVANHAIDELVFTGTSTRVFSNKPLINAPVIAGSLTIRLYRTGSASNLVTFTDVGANTSNLANVTLLVDTAHSSTGWLNSTCVVNYVSGTILSAAFQSTPTNTDTFLATYDYQGYPFIVQAYQLTDVPGFSGKPVAQVSLWKKGPFTITGLAPATYTLLGFIDQNGDGRLRSPETWGFVRNLVPETGPGYQEIHTLTVGPSIPFTAGVKVMMRDRDTDNDKLPDAWEIQKFGAITAYSGEQVLNGKTIWQSYADGPVDANPLLWDSDFDGLPDAVELALGFNTHNPSSIGYAKGISDLEAYISGDFTGNTHFEIPTFTTDGAGRPEIVWNSPEVIAGTQIRYTVLRTTDLSARWVAITPEVLALSGDAPQLRTFVDTAAPAGAFYKLQAAVEAAP